MDIVGKIASFFHTKKETTLSKSLLSLIVLQYGAAYIVFDRRSGKPTDSTIEEYDARYHKVWIEDEDRYREMFSMV